METTGRYNEDTLSGTDASYGTATTIAAVFTDRERAHDAAHRLHDEGFRDTWIGLTRLDDTAGYAASGAGTGSTETRVESENWFTRFFGDGDESLHEALVRHGVSQADAAAAGTLPAHSAILTVDGANHPELAAQIISECSGELITRGLGATGYGTTGAYGSTTGMAGMSAMSDVPSSRTTSLAEDGAIGAAAVSPAMTGLDNTGVAGAGGYGDYGKYRGGTSVDDSTRLQLREERLRIDKTRVSRGEATVGTEIVTETQNVDVPLIREELFIQRRPVSASTVADTTPIGTDSEVIRVPLTEEKLSVSKTAVVTEEIVVGKRQVEETQHVSETTRKEKLNVMDVDAGTGVTAGTSTLDRGI